MAKRCRGNGQEFRLQAYRLLKLLALKLKTPSTDSVQLRTMTGKLESLLSLMSRLKLLFLPLLQLNLKVILQVFVFL